MFALKNLFSTSNSVEPDDLMNTKTALNRLGYYTIPPHRGIDDWTDDDTFNGLKRFQRDNGLKVDGLMRPGGPTETALGRNLMRVSSSGDGSNDKSIDSTVSERETLRRNNLSPVSVGLEKFQQGLGAAWDAAGERWNSLQSSLRDARNAPGDIAVGLFKDTRNTGKVALDFMSNFTDMRDADFIGGDKYFHCKANCQASQRGRLAEKSAAGLSDLREVYGSVKGDSRKDNEEDQEANRYGRWAGRESPKESCRSLCFSYRPKGLPERY